MNVTAPQSGNGSSENPYQISQIEHIYWLAQLAQEDKTTEKHFRQICDINAAAGQHAMVPIGSMIGEIGEQVVHSFDGVYDGCGHVIRNLIINQPQEYAVGLFGIISKNGRVSNVHVVASVVIGLGNVGCLVGINRGTIENCSARGIAVAKAALVGLLVGRNNDSGIIRRCCAIGRAACPEGEYVGGLVGSNDFTLELCEATTEVIGRENIGGLIGGNTGSVSMCRAKADVTGGKTVGGLLGRSGTSTKEVVVSDCYCHSNVTAGNFAGALVGSTGDDATFRNCYASGKLECQGTHYGGLAGFNSLGVGYSGPAKFEQCFLDNMHSGSPQGASDLKSRATYVGWDFDRIWSIRDGVDLPKLRDCGLDSNLAAAIAKEFDTADHSIEVKAAASAIQEATK
jgi:hypothetical protein